MARRKHHKAISIDVEPFLSIMAIVLKLISLILVVIVMRIAVNPKARKVVALAGLWGGHGNLEEAKEPRYIDCYKDKIIIYPGTITNTWEALQRPDNAVEKTLIDVQEHAKSQYVVIMARPESVKFFRYVRKMVSLRPIDVGYDAVDADFQVNWDEARKALSVSTGE